MAVKLAIETTKSLLLLMCEVGCSQLLTIIITFVEEQNSLLLIVLVYELSCSSILTMFKQIFTKKNTKDTQV